MTLTGQHTAPDNGAVASELIFDGGQVPCTPVVTIAIPTFNRPQLVQKAIASALGQTLTPPFEILIVDNASRMPVADDIRQHLDSLGPSPIRFYRNAENLGMFGNWNRCIDLARGTWITILNDDDLLHPEHLKRMLAYADGGRQDTSYTCNFDYLDQRRVRPRAPGVTAALLVLKRFLRFRGRREIALTPKRLFWSNIAGSSLGCLFPRALAVEIGGFRAEEFPSADYLFHVRASLKGRLRQVADRLGTVRLQVNETMNPDTSRGFVLRNHEMRAALVNEGAVPRGWARLLPVLVDYEIRATKRIWGVDLDRAQIAKELNLDLRRVPSGLVWLLKAAMGGV